MTIPYKKAPERRKQILEAACQLAQDTHYLKVRRHQLADKCGTASGNISRVMGSMSDLRQSMIEYALENDQYSDVVAQAIVNKDAAVNHLTTEQRSKYLASIA